MILQTIVSYRKALALLDDYDHHQINKPEGTIGCYHITYEECCDIINLFIMVDENTIRNRIENVVIKNRYYIKFN